MYLFLGIGMDDAFIFVKIWETTLAERMKAASVRRSLNTGNAEGMRLPKSISGKRKTSSIFKIVYYFIGTFICRMKRNEPAPHEPPNPIATVTLENFEEAVAVRDDLDYNWLMAKTLKHSALSMFVTSFTTASAFFVSYLSNITAIRCFGFVFYIEKEKFILHS